MTPEPTDPPSRDDTTPPADEQTPRQGTPAETEDDVSETLSEPPSDPADDDEAMDRPRDGALVIARSEGRVRLRDNRVIVLEDTMSVPNGGVAARCQAIAGRFDVDPSGKAAGQCERAARRGFRVCPMHGAGPTQALARARRQLVEAAPMMVETLVGLALDGRTKDTDRLRAIDSALDRAALARQSDVRMDVGQIRQDITGRLDAIQEPSGPAAIEQAESPGEDAGTVGPEPDEPASSPKPVNGGRDE